MLRKLSTQKLFHPKLLSQLLDCPFLDSGDVAPGDAEKACHLPLGERLSPKKSVAKDDYLALAVVKQVESLVEPLGVEDKIDLLADVTIHRDDVHQRELVAVLVGIDRLVKMHVLSRFLHGAEVHEDFVFDAPRPERREPVSLPRVERVHRLYEPYRANRDELLLLVGGDVVLLHDVRHEPEIVEDERVPRGGISLRKSPEKPLLLGGAQRLRKRALVLDVKSEPQQTGKYI